MFGEGSGWEMTTPREEKARNVMFVALFSVRCPSNSGVGGC